MSKKEIQFNKLKKMIEKSGLFDKVFYVKTYRDARTASETLLDHFIKIGLKEDRKPNAEFDPVWYREYYTDVKKDGTFPFIHYILHGNNESRFQNSHHVSRDNVTTKESEEDLNQVVENEGLKDLTIFYRDYPYFFSEEFIHFNIGKSLNRNNFLMEYNNYVNQYKKYPQVSVYFDPNYYLSKNIDVSESRTDPLTHFLTSGLAEKRSPHPLIDLNFIEGINPNAVTTLETLIEYILNNGQTSPYFDSLYYYQVYPDIKEAGILALVHFITTGANEKRQPNCYFDYTVYEKNRQISTNGYGLILDFIEYGDSNKIHFSDLFDYDFYGSNVIDDYDMPLYKHYVCYGKDTGLETKKRLDFDSINPFASNELFVELKQKISDSVLEESHIAPEIFKIDDSEALNTIKTIVLPTQLHNPEISIVIPVYNAIKELAECLLSINKYVTGSYEIIIADDLSPDPKIEESLQNHTSIRYIKNEKNLGFLLNVNNAVDKAKGKYVFLLNSDVQLLDDSPNILKTALKNDELVGIVGPKIIFPNGMLQEAGSAIYKNCNTEMVGMGKNMNDPAYNFSRYVDYISGASWLFEKELFDKLGNFDTTYAPAYAEDLEFCAKVTQFGKKILYMPTTTIVHHLSVSSESLSSTFKYYQSAVNKAKFNQKYQQFYKESSKIKPIAFYLPQFHDIKQNSYWWGKNYTEWTAAANAKQQYKGHYQPHIPADLGFYDLTHPRIFEKQASLAKQYGIHGFCFYYYNFGDFELMEKALESFKSSNADINFCLCWANENWTKRWDGQDEDILLEQKGNDNQFFLKVLQDMERFLDDKRYIKIDGKPLVLIYRESLFDDIFTKLNLWRNYWRERHNEELYICAVDSIERAGGDATNPHDLGFDAAVEFPAHNIQTRTVLEDEELLEDNNFEGHLLNYHDVVSEICTRKHPGYKRFPGCFPAWDNTPRRDNKSVIMKHQHPTSFQVFLEEKAKEALLLSGDERMMFINAWNEWGEGTHLEPDLKFGHSLLSAVDKVVKEN